MSAQQDRTDRFAVLREAFRADTGKVLTSAIVIGVASDGEVYYGATCEDPSDVPALLAAIRKAEKFCSDTDIVTKRRAAPC